MIEIREVLRLWLRGEGYRSIARLTPQDRKTARYLRTLYPPDVRIAIVLDNFSPHLSTKTDTRVGDWAAANNVERANVA